MTGPLPAYLTTSWDDGDPQDTRIAELLAKHRIPGTFYVPCYNREKREVISNSSLRDLAGHFEIGSHTLDHYPIDGKDLEEIHHQVVDGKTELENRIGKEVDLFCYPGGRNHSHSREIVRDAGFRYARTTADFNLSPGTNPYLITTTAQFRFRRPPSLAFNFLKWDNRMHRVPLLFSALKGTSMQQQLLHMLDAALQKGGAFHLWGHAYQIEEAHDWEALDQFLALLAEKYPISNRMTNGQLFNKLVDR